MTVRELIDHLATFDPDLPVYVDDWNEQYMEPAEVTAEHVDLDWRTDVPPRLLIGA